MDNSSKIKLLRFMYWYGAIQDLVVGILMIISMFTQPAIILPYFGTTEQYRFAMGWATVFMFAWTVLLIWADQEPLERKAVLLFTIFPIVSGFIIVELIIAPIELMTLWMSQLFSVLLPMLITYALVYKLE